jgi:hypothetical protein
MVNKHTCRDVWRYELRQGKEIFFYTRVQRDPEAHANSCTVSKAAGAWVWNLPPTPFSSEVQTG